MSSQLMYVQFAKIGMLKTFQQRTVHWNRIQTADVISFIQSYMHLCGKVQQIHPFLFIKFEVEKIKLNGSWIIQETDTDRIPLLILWGW